MKSLMGCFPCWLCPPAGGLTLGELTWGCPRSQPQGYTCPHPMAAPAILLHLCSFSTLFWARAIREQPWMVAGLPAGLEPGTCFSPASIAWLGRGWGRAEPDFPAARASIKEGDLFCSWQASPLITQSLQMLWQGRICAQGKDLGLNAEWALLFPPTQHLSHPPYYHGITPSFLFSCRIALLTGISPGKLKVKAKSSQLQLVKANHAILC